MSSQEPLVFRKQAIDYLEESASTGHALFLESPNAKWIVGFTILLSVTFILWMCFGSISFKETGRGVLINQSGFLVSAFASEDGFVEKIHVLPGDTIKKDQLLLSLTNPNLKNQLRLQQEQLKTLEQEKKILNLQYRNENILQQQITNLQTKAYTEITNFQKSFLESLNKNVKIRENISKLGFMPKIQFEEQLRVYHDLIKQYAENNAQLVRVEKNQKTFEDEWKQKFFKNNTDILLKQIEIKNTSNQLARAVSIYSPIDGIVTDILVSIGTQAKSGQNVLNISPLISNLEVLLLLPAQRGQVVKPGMAAIVEPAGIDMQIYGGLKATVSDVYYYPVSKRSLLSILQNEETVNNFFTASKELFLIRLALKRNSNSANGYLWTSKKGESQNIHAGNLCTGNISIKSERPISLLIPGFKKLVGIRE